MNQRHLVSVWNPAYAVDAMDAHVQVLLSRAADHRAGKLEEDDVYVWWGRVRSKNREGGLPHLADVLALDDQIQAETPTYLFLTDYRSLYVADVGEVTVDDVRARDGERAAMPSYYKDLECDAWFRIWDIRRLVADDTLAVVEELKTLLNVRYHNHPVSLYGGITELPLIVERQTDVDWFGDRAELTEGRLWAETDAELRGESARISSDLRDNLFGRRLWQALNPATRTFLASAEAVLRTRREDPVFDFSGPAIQLAKAVEVEANDLVFGFARRALAEKAPGARTIHVDGRTLDLGRPVPFQTLGTIKRLLTEEPILGNALKISAQLRHTFLTDPYKLPAELGRVQELRNPAAHTGLVAGESVLRLRERLLGIGCHGVMSQMAEVKVLHE